jgi:hypothetical protein
MSRTEFEFVPALPHSWTLTPQDLVLSNEEAAHAVVACLMGLAIHEARIDRPDPDVLGHVLVDRDFGDIRCDEDLDIQYYKRLLAVLAGPMCTRRWETGKWPLDETEPGDVGLAGRLCRWLRYDRVDLFMAERRVEELLRDPSVRRALRAMGSELLTHGAIPGGRVSELVPQADVDDEAVKPAFREGHLRG